MADLSSEFLGIRSPNPFWLASAPPTDKAYNVNRAFEAGWGGAVWKTLGEDPPIVNVSGPRYGAIHSNERRVIGFNNIELITDRPLKVNLDEIRTIKKDWPDRALLVSVMLPMNEAVWKKYVPMIEDTGADGIELNFGCPHGMSERGMGAAVGQVPDYIRMATEWCRKFAKKPVIVKLTPNVTNVLPPAKAAWEGGADAVSLINTINSIMRVNYETLTMYPTTDGMGSHGGYCGPAVKPIALHMVAEIARNRETAMIPISGIGGITDWRDAVDFLALGASNVQVCTAAMVYGFRIIDDLTAGLSDFLDRKNMRSVSELVGKAVQSVTDWQYLNLNYVEKAVINQDLCIQCGRCHIVCEDASHQAITSTVNGERHFEVIDAECVGCNLCVSVCPVDNCITMEQMTNGVDPRTGRAVSSKKADWTTHPNNPMRKGS
ncbi:MAG: NAD-dependent dihydropyrimidine dehydrogenase subunit PreA [Gammaproteobacteria bacterium]|nr:NAD-dependent dihydropyrimidine dehydrogenase subunit PreA [Gammaproteobacteria bacterium]MDH4314060.1 NAD-dependent dihydropyrimidine dehydrogenase subunit PreA [Gammaproteobacteria bacterium]MDH5213500.1 NAD-dependent dihydropyrimidine dehydrogenase subunit PreA [Gammaproteobacteria bacterium]MDH5500610.1 NAD-dependent dihydropyrimidine dehydrogenase subunit PreA [Gammaproteobacteria bacterium]